MSLKNEAILENMVENSVNSNFHKYFLEVVNKYGKVHEIELQSRLMDMTDFSGLKHNASQGLRLLRKGKLRIRAPKTEQHESLSDMLEKTQKKVSK